MIREQIILEIARGKKVLDVGSVGQSDIYCQWEELKKHASSLVGVDLPESVDTLTKEFDLSESGYSHAKDPNIVYGNMETVELGETFDVIVAGDVIEHTSNQGLFLDNIRRHLADDGQLVITTPNAKWPTVFLKPNVTHTLWHDIYTLKTLLTRHGFKINYWRYYFGNKPHYNWLLRLLLWRQSILLIAKKA